LNREALHTPPAKPHFALAAPRAPQLLGLDTRAHHAAGRAGGGGGGAPWAIDLGAAPGAWTQHLAGALGYRVVAVDPGALAPEVLTLPGVHHVRALSEDAAGAVRALLRGGGGGGGCGGDGGGGEGEAAEGEGGAEVLVSDMNMHPFEVAPVRGRSDHGGWKTLGDRGRG
jgi:hypothetical protein